MNKLKLMLHHPTRGDWREINKNIAKEAPDLCVVLGDFGYQPHLETRGLPYPSEEDHWYMSEGINTSSPVLFIDGPLDDFEELESQGSRNKNAIQIYERCLYIPRGVLMELCTGHTVLFMGGAYPDIREHELRRAEEHEEVDIVLSYDKRKYFPNFPTAMQWYWGRDSTTYTILNLQGREEDRYARTLRIRHRD